MDTKDATGDGKHNGAHSVTHVGPSTTAFTLALVHNYGATITPDTCVHHITIACNVDATLDIAKQQGYTVRQEDGDTCILSPDQHAFKLVPVIGEQEKPSVSYVR